MRRQDERVPLLGDLVPLRPFEASDTYETLLHSIWLNEVRARQIREGAGFVDPATSLVVDGVRQMEAGLLAAQVLREVQDLPEAQRGAVFLVYVEGLSYREAAAVLAIPIGTVMSRLAAARDTLARRTGQAATAEIRTFRR